MSITRKFLTEPSNVAKEATVINANQLQSKKGIGVIDETKTLPFKEKSRVFTLSRRQIESEYTLNAAKSLAIKHAKIIVREEDKEVLDALYDAGIKAKQNFNVPKAKTDEENAKALIVAVRKAIKILQVNHHDGPYALILNTDSFYEINCPVDNSFTTAADRLGPVIEKGIIHAPTLNKADAADSDKGLLVSLGGKTMDIARSVNPAAEFLHTDASNDYVFRIYHRFAFRLMQPDSVVSLSFK